MKIRVESKENILLKYKLIYKNKKEPHLTKKLELCLLGHNSQILKEPPDSAGISC